MSRLKELTQASFAAALVVMAFSPAPASADNRKTGQFDVGGGFFEEGGENSTGEQPASGDGSGGTSFDKYGNEVQPAEEPAEPEAAVDGAIGDTADMYALPSNRNAGKRTPEQESELKAQEIVEEVRKQLEGRKKPVRR